MTTWIEDSNGNKCSIEYFGSKEEAQKALDSLVRCYNCINCSDCSCCRDCRDCSDCSGCSDCSDCSDCSGCINCSDCSGCSGCINCSDCSGCSDCSDCFHKENLIDFVGLIRPSSKIPVIENIHQKILEAVLIPGAFDMSTWHTCETTHCRAGWAVHLAGDAGKALELFHRSTCLAAQLIYRESSPIKVSLNKFFVNNIDALEDIKRCAELELQGKRK